VTVPLAGLEGPPVVAARGLLGMTLESRVGGVLTAIVMTEVEAYGGADDPASHAFRGPTARNRAMFGPPGTVYVYRSYGVHWCLNIVCGPEGTPSAVLIRAGIPVAGVDTMILRRGRQDHIADGPGRVAQALGVTGHHDGTTIVDGPVRVTGATAAGKVEETPRIGISRARSRPWRLILRA
jgi:DNA-3-methyladenine glycosylase